MLAKFVPPSLINDPRTAIHLAARGGHIEVLEALLEEQSEEQKKLLVNQADNNGITPVFLTIQKCAAVLPIKL